MYKLVILTKYSFMDINTSFEQAVEQSKSLSEKPSNEILLQLYALFKQAKEGDINIEPPVNPFDFVAKAKFTAWEELKGKSSDEAKQAYIDLVKSLQS
jgi:diazepam-binding inhibitor (GABA receptor modulator, acyl-CoA-binding protein)